MPPLTKVIFYVLFVGFALVRPASGQVLEDDVEDFAELDLEAMLNYVVSAAKHKQDVLLSPSAIWYTIR